ncbi:hypothetical protein [Arthrobacter sp. Leaf69]|nr:hypothetical protein [Arthrobacter sp. Leaf69]
MTKLTNVAANSFAEPALNRRAVELRLHIAPIVLGAGERLLGRRREPA